MRQHSSLGITSRTTGKLQIAHIIRLKNILAPSQNVNRQRLSALDKVTVGTKVLVLASENDDLFERLRRSLPRGMRAERGQHFEQFVAADLGCHKKQSAV